MADTPVDKEVRINYNGETFSISDVASEADVRRLMGAQYPEVANAAITKDPATGDWTITREAGQKG